MGAVLLGILSIVAALIIGWAAYHATIRATEQRYQRYYLSKAILLSSFAKCHPDVPARELLTEIESAWYSIQDRPPDEYICIINNDSKLILHSSHPQTVGNDAGDNILIGNKEQTHCTLRDLSNNKEPYVGDYISSSGEEQLAAFYPVSQRDWTIGVHRSKTSLRNEMHSDLSSLVTGFLLVCGLLLPASLLILYRSSFLSLLASKKNQQQLQKSEERFRTMSEDMPVLICQYHPDGVLTYVNKAYCDFFQKTSKELIGTSFLTLVLKEDHQSILSDIAKLTPNSPLHSDEHRVLSPEGEIKWQSWNNRALFDEMGKPIAYQAIGEDITEKKQAEQNLTIERQKLDTVLDLIPGFVYLQSRDYSIHYANAKFYEMFGEPNGRPCYSALHHRDEPCENCPTFKVFETKKEQSWEWKSPDNQTFMIYDIPFPRTDHEEFMILEMALDITDLKKAEEELKRYRDIFDHNRDGIVLVDENGQFIDANQAYCQMLGYSFEELKSLGDFYSITPKKWHQWEKEEILGKRLPEEGYSGVYQKEYIGKNNRIFPVELEAYQATNIQGEILYYWGIVRDITERQKIEAERDRLSLAIEQAAEIIVITDTQGTIQYVNPAFEHITGYTQKEAIGQNPRILKSGKHNDSFYQEMWAELSQGKIWKGRLINKKKDGSLYTEEASISPFHDTTGKTIGYVAAKFDITQMVDLEERLRQAQKMEAVGQLTGGIAHDFNNLLQAINGYTELALELLDKEHQASNYIKEVSKAGNRAAKLVSQLLAFSRQQVLEMKEVDLNQIVTNLVSMFRQVLGEHISLKIIPSHQLYLVQADPGQMEQVLINLCVNARDAMPTGGTITIKTKNLELTPQFCEMNSWAKPGCYVCLAVSDTGCGIDQETLKNIFEPFFTTKEIGQGSGLGLSTVYGLIKQHRGIINVLSEVGKGTTFEIYLPQSLNPPIEKKQSPPPATITKGTETILLAEDDTAVLELTTSILEQAGYKVTTVTNGVEALELLHNKSIHIDLALLDVMMPALGGKAVFDQVHKERPNIRFLFASGYNMNALHTDFILDEGLDLLQKPYHREDLLRLIRNILDT